MMILKTFFIAGVAVLLSGCAVAGYTGNRVKDAFGIVVVQPDFGGGASVRVGPVVAGRYKQTGIMGFHRGVTEGMNTAEAGMAAAQVAGGGEAVVLLVPENSKSVERVIPRVQLSRRPGHYLEAETRIGAGIGVRAKTSLFECFDFLAGFLGFDPADDDWF